MKFQGSTLKDAGVNPTLEVHAAFSGMNFMKIWHLFYKLLVEKT
jgi:hypothetical protein